MDKQKLLKEYKKMEQKMNQYKDKYDEYRQRLGEKRAVDHA